jgi:mono/diheme cytochrome c family protein
MSKRPFRLSRQVLIGLVVIAAAWIWNPSRLDSRDKQLAKALFRGNCAACHGIDGHGDGPDAVNVSFPMPDLMAKKLKHGNGFGQIRHVIADGQPDHGMPGFRGKLRSIELDLVTWELVRMRKTFARQSPPPPPPVAG